MATEDINNEGLIPDGKHLQEGQEMNAENATHAISGTSRDHEAAAAGGSDNMEFILDIPLEITVELGRTHMVINDLLKLSQGSVIELSKVAGETLEILANQKLIARGEAVVVNEKFGVRLTEVISPMARIKGLK